MVNPNWTRWIFVSVSKFFNDRKPNIPFYIEGQDVTEDIKVDFAEFRFMGPDTKRLNPSDYQLDILINILLNIVKDQKDAHKLFRICGQFEKIFQPCIPVYKFGDTIDDDNTIKIGELQLVSNNDNDISTVHYGQLDIDIRVLQSTVEGKYRIFLTR